MSAPFPETALPQASPAAAHHGAAQVIEERDDFVPPWYVPHETPGLIRVTENGKPVPPGFTVADVLPERRWAIQPDGELLSGLDFKEQYLNKCELWFRYCSIEAKQGITVRGPHKDWSRHRVYVPSPRDYVCVQVDPTDPRREIPLGFDPHATEGARPDTLYDGEGEEVAKGHDRMKLLIRAYRETPEKLTAKETEEVEAHLKGRSGAGMTSEQVRLQAQIEALTRMRAEGRLTADEHSAQMAQLFGVEVPQAEAGAPAPPPAEAAGRRKKKGGGKGRRTMSAEAKARHRESLQQVMPCGEKVWRLQAKNHRQRCEACATSE